MTFIVDSNAEIMRIFPDTETDVHIENRENATKKYYLPFKANNTINIEKFTAWPRAEMFIDVLDNVTTLDK